jgi:hypothetical protein
MSILLLSELKESLDTRSSLYVLPDIDKLLSLMGTKNPDKQRIEFYKRALEKWHHQIPLIRLTRQTFDSNQYRFKDNFAEIVKNGCPCNVDLISLIPTRIISLNGVIGGYRRNWVYQDGILHLFATGTWNLNAVYMRPIYYEFDSAGILSDKSCIGFIEDRHKSKFIDACLLEILMHISQLKKNFEYPNLPITLFGGIDDAISELKDELEKWYSGLTHAKIYR